MDKKQKEVQRRQEDAALNRALVWVGAAIVLELLLLLVNKYYVNVSMTEASANLAIAIRTGLKAVRIISLAGFAACGVWTWLSGKKQNKSMVPAVCLMGCAALCFCAHIALVYGGSGLRMLFLLVPAWAALALVYYLYQREFFICAAVAGMAVVALWLIRYRGMSALTLYLYLAVMAVVLAVCVMFVLKARKVQGDEAEKQLLPEETNYAVIFTAIVVSVAVVALGLVLGSTLAYYLVYGLVACLFGLLVYYTVKMM